MFEKLTEFCKNHGLAFLVEYDGEKLLKFMFISNNPDNEVELIGAARGGRCARAHKPRQRYCQDIFLEGYLKAVDKDAIINLMIDGVKTAFHID